MDDRDYLLKKIKELVVQTLDLAIDSEELPEDEPLFGASYAIDSILALELIAAVERAFAISVSDDDLVVDLFDSIGALALFVERKTANVLGRDREAI